MALGVGSVVSPRLRSAALAIGSVSAQPTRFGVLSAYAAPNASVLWDQGGPIETTVPDTTFDEIGTASGASLTAWLGKTVRSTAGGEQGNNLRMVVVMVFVRDPGSTNVTVAVCKLLNSEGWLEVPVSTLAVVSG